jgi:hypothetical protein
MLIDVSNKTMVIYIYIYKVGQMKGKKITIKQLLKNSHIRKIFGVPLKRIIAECQWKRKMISD